MPDKALPAQSPELTEARSALEANDSARVLELASPYLDSTRPALAGEANKLSGLAHFRQNEFAQAFPFFQKAAEGSDDAGAWFNVVTAGTLAGERAIAENAFAEALACQERAGYSQQPSVPFIRFYYACALRDVGAYSRALEEIEKLRTIYENLHITDSTFLYMRGVPFFSHTMTLATEVLRGLGSDPLPWLDAVAKNVDEEGAEYLLELRSKSAAN